MKKILKSATVVAGLTLAGAAFAGGPDHMAPPPMSAFYVGAFIGPTASTLGNTNNINPGFDVGGQLGYRWNPHMRAELQYTYWRNTTAAALFGAIGATLSFHTLMANVYYDANPIVYNIHPYFGVGIGWWNAYSGTLANFPANGISNSVSEFAYQGIGGLSYQFMQSLSVYGEYRIVSWTNAVGFYNAVNFGLNYFFNI